MWFNVRLQEPTLWSAEFGLRLSVSWAEGEIQYCGNNDGDEAGWQEIEIDHYF